MPNSKLKMKNLIVFAFALFTLHISLCNINAQVAVKGETVWTMTGEPITNGVVLIGANGKIEKVGTGAQVSIPANYKVLTAKVITPGLIDAHSVVGLNGAMNQPQDQMALDGSAPMQPELRAIDAYNPEETLIGWIRSFGVTTVHTGHAPAALISGQTMIAKTFGKTVEDVTLIPTAMIAVTIGEAAQAAQGRSPGTRAKEVAMIRAELVKAQEAVRKGTQTKSSGDNPTRPAVTSSNNNDNSPNAANPNSSATNPPPQNNQTQGNVQTITNVSVTTDLRGEMMQKVIRREIPLLITAHRAIDIMSALRIAKEFNIRIVLDGAAESYNLTDEIKAANIPVIIHPTMYRAGGETENLSLETASKLKKAGITVALQSGFEGYVPKTRVVLYEAAVAAANGLTQREALATITIDAAKIIGLDNRIGSLAAGKDGDIAMFDGDPFEYTSHCTGTIINGKVASEIVR